MPMMNFFVLTSAQKTACEALDSPANGVNVDARAIDNASPGVGINLNDNASDYAPADPVTLTGCFVLPKKIVDDPLYQEFCASLCTALLLLPFCSLETETIFAPSDV